MRTAITSALLCLAAATASAQQTTTTEKSDTEKATPVNIHGTIRSKYEYQTSEGEGRFEVRNARISVDGSLSPVISYKAEIDLCDEGKIKMLDAYTRLKPVSGLQFTIGQMRVPFTIDAHRSPHQQYFANRSFIAKQVGNVRDVGAALGYSFNAGIPIILEAGMFNGSGLTNQKDFWTKSVNFSAKAQMFLPGGFNLTLSTQKIKPDHVNVMMYDAGAYWHAKGWHVEAEYLYKLRQGCLQAGSCLRLVRKLRHPIGQGTRTLRDTIAALRLYERPQRRDTLSQRQGGQGRNAHRQRFATLTTHLWRYAEPQEAIRQRHPIQL